MRNNENGQSHYSEALRSGMREYKKGVSSGQSGTLPFLEGLIKNVNIVTEVDLGTVDIPLNKIVGTYAYSRSVSFAGNFMPLLGNNTEFGEKWRALCEAHLEEGIKYPIKVYEYMNWFYAEEGNKRVSVLKYFNAHSIFGKVRRLIPQYDENDINIRIYYEFLNFYKKSKINCLWFSKEKRFEELWVLLEAFEPKVVQGGDKYRYFTYSIYFPFRKAYHEVGGGKLPITTGDAFLEYAKLYGISDTVYEDEVKSRLSVFITELGQKASMGSVDIQTVPVSVQSNRVLSSISSFMKPNRKLKVAFAYANTVKSSNWTYAHDIGRMHVEKELERNIETAFVDRVPEGLAAYPHLKKLAEDGNDIIFATHPTFINGTLKAALEFTGVRFLNCSETHSYRHVNTYFGRIYEPRFLLGIIAGVMTKTDVIGYVARRPEPGNICSINAFALGAKMVNASIKVKVAWMRNVGENDEDPCTAMVNEGVDIISHQNALANREFTREFGLYSVACDVKNKKCVPQSYIASPVWNWGIFYEKIITDILNEPIINMSDLLRSDLKRINYWWGMESGVVDLFYSTRLVPRETQKLIYLMKKMIEENVFHPFTGPIYDQKGILRVKKNEVASYQQILNMNWLADTVETELPPLETAPFYLPY